MAVALSGCKDYTDDFNEIDNRLDRLEQTLPTIEEQIESIHSQLTSLKAIDDAIKAEIAEIERSNTATATEIDALKAKDSALEKSINDLQSYVDTEIAKAKSESEAAYATIEQYNTIVADLSALQTATNKLGESLTAKIDAAVKNLNDKIRDLESRLKAVEDKVENLLKRIQSVSYIPQYSDGKALIAYVGKDSQLSLDFEISPKSAIADLANMYREVLSVKAVYTKSRAISFVDMPIQYFYADESTGVISLMVSGINLSAEFINRDCSASVALSISDGNNTITSDYIPLVVQSLITESQEEIPTNEIWYTSTDGAIVTPFSGELNNYATPLECFGANILSNTYENGVGVIRFDATITDILNYAFYGCSTLRQVIVSDSILFFDLSVFENCAAFENISVGKGVAPSL